MADLTTDAPAIAPPRPVGLWRRLHDLVLPERGVLRPLPWAIVCAAAAAAGLWLALTDTAQRLEWALYDRLVRIAARNPSPPDLLVVAIDEPSFEAVGRNWPWPRRMHARLVDRLTAAGARAIVFDVVFDRESPDPEDDRLFAEAIRRSRRVVLAMDRVAIADAQYALEDWIEPTPALAAAAAAAGAVTLPYDPDGVLRRTAYLVDDRPTLALAAAEIAGATRPLDAGAPRLLHFNGPPRQGIRTLSYYQALDPQAAPDRLFRDRIVLVGHSLQVPPADAGALDSFATPVSRQMAGVEIHANAIDTLLRGRSPLDPFSDPRALVAYGLAAALIAGWAAYVTAPLASLAALAFAGVGLTAGAYALLAAGTIRVPVLAPFAVAACVQAAGLAYRQALGRRERRLVLRAFEHYVAPVIVQQLLRDPSRLSLAGEEYDATVLFSDLEGFTSSAERQPPAAIRAQLSTYLTAMMDVLLAERATLDKFIGDAIMVYFGCPIADPAHPEQACRATLRMQQALARLNAAWVASGRDPVRMRIGINTGRLVAGNMGSATVFHYTVIGDSVNLASRLEQVNKIYGTLVLAGEETWRRAGHLFEGREIDRIRVKGKAVAVAIYELAAERGHLPPERHALFEAYAAGLDAYRRRDWTAARAAFERALELDPGDGPSRVLRGRCDAFLAAAPPDDWDGVHVVVPRE